MTTHAYNLIAAVLLAQADAEPKPGRLASASLEDVASNIRNQGPQYDIPWQFLVATIGATLILIVAISLKRWWQSRHQDPNPLVLFSAIARKAGLTWPDRFLLWRIARTCQLPTPIALLLARGSLRHYTDIYLSNRSPATTRRLTQRLDRIEAELFG